MSEQHETALVVVPTEQTYSREQIDLLKRTIADGTNDDEFALFLEVAKRTGLDPFAKQIYAVMRWDSQANRKKMTIQTSIDGYLAIAERSGRLAGIDDIEFDEENTPPRWARARVWKMVSGQRVPFVYTARWAEYVQTDKNGAPTSMWKRMSYTMLGKCALTRALRLGFPSQMGGVYTAEEMAQADSEPVVVEAASRSATVTPAGRVVVEETGEVLSEEQPTRDAPAPLRQPTPIRQQPQPVAPQQAPQRPREAPEPAAPAPAPAGPWNYLADVSFRNRCRLIGYKTIDQVRQLVEAAMGQRDLALEQVDQARVLRRLETEEANANAAASAQQGGQR